MTSTSRSVSLKCSNVMDILFWRLLTNRGTTRAITLPLWNLKNSHILEEILCFSYVFSSPPNPPIHRKGVFFSGLPKEGFLILPLYGRSLWLVCPSHKLWRHSEKLIFYEIWGIEHELGNFLRKPKFRNEKWHSRHNKLVAAIILRGFQFSLSKLNCLFIKSPLTVSAFFLNWKYFLNWTVCSSFLLLCSILGKTFHFFVDDNKFFSYFLNYFLIRRHAVDFSYTIFHVLLYAWITKWSFLAYMN